MEAKIKALALIYDLLQDTDFFIGHQGPGIFSGFKDILKEVAVKIAKTL